MLAHVRERARTSPRRRTRTLVLEPLEDRTLLTGNPPFAVGGDPSVNPADFRVTTFASGLNYPHGMMTLSDGSLLVAVNNPLSGSSSFFNTHGRIAPLHRCQRRRRCRWRRTGSVRQSARRGDRSAPGRRLDPGDQQRRREASESPFSAPVRPPAHSLTLVGSINFSFPANWEHTTYASVVRPTPGQSGNYDLIFNIGSQYNGVVIGSNGNVVLDPQREPDLSANDRDRGCQRPDQRHAAGRLAVHGHAPRQQRQSGRVEPDADRLRPCAMRRAWRSTPASGNLYFADNGIDGNDGGNEAWSADELDAHSGGADRWRRALFRIPGNDQWSAHPATSKPSTSRAIR